MLVRTEMSEKDIRHELSLAYRGTKDSLIAILGNGRTVRSEDLIGEVQRLCETIHDVIK